jgi:ABC-type anion transport system duplicated permease subunit
MVELLRRKEIMNIYKVVREMRQVILFPWTLAAIAKKSRHVQSIAAVTACAAFLFGVQSLPALGQVTVGLVVGTTRDPQRRERYGYYLAESR